MKKFIIWYIYNFGFDYNLTKTLAVEVIFDGIFLFWILYFSCKNFLFIYLKNLEFFLKDDQFRKLYFLIVKNWEFPYEVSKIGKTGKIGNLVLLSGGLTLQNIFKNSFKKKLPFKFHEIFWEYWCNHKSLTCIISSLFDKNCGHQKLRKWPEGCKNWRIFINWLSWKAHLNKKTDNGVTILNTLKRYHIYKCGIVGILIMSSTWCNIIFFKK